MCTPRCFGGTVVLVAALLLPLVACGGQPAPSRPAAPAPAAPASAPAAAATQAAPVMGSAAVPAGPPAKVRIGVLNLVGEAAIYAALDKGYFQEQNLEVELIPFTQPTDQLPALTTGQIDFAATGVYPNAFNATERAIAVKVVSYLSVVSPRSTSAGLVVRQDHVDSGRYREPRDFRGMTVALAQPPGGTTHYYLERFASLAGIAVEDMELTVVPYAQISTALVNKAIDGAYSVEPFIGVAEQQGVGKFVVPNGQFIPGMPVFVLQISPVFAREQPQVADRFMLALLKGQRFNYNAVLAGEATDELYQILQNHTPIKDAGMLARMVTDAVAPDGIMDPTPLSELQEAYLRYGTVRQRVEIGEVLDPAYAARAVQQLGR
jgi:NitT/TauT family transport system substrate-binding protein